MDETVKGSEGRRGKEAVDAGAVGADEKCDRGRLAREKEREREV